MMFVDMDGNELDREEIDFDTGRLLQSEDDPEIYVFSPWDTVPPREEESAPL